jgi:hypothetical protein
MQGKSRCNDHLAPTKQADFIMPLIAEICVPRFFKDEDFAAARMPFTKSLRESSR